MSMCDVSISFTDRRAYRGVTINRTGPIPDRRRRLSSCFGENVNAYIFAHVFDELKQ